LTQFFIFPSFLTENSMDIFVSLWLLLSGLQPAGTLSVPFQKGKASYYAAKFTGRRTAFGERVDANALEAAHRTLPRNTLVEVTNLQNHRSVVVRINDRGPFAKGRIMDLTYAAAKSIGLIQRGVGMVSLRVVGKANKARKPVSVVLPAALTDSTDCRVSVIGE
jgi:rare lipoprotein A